MYIASCGDLIEELMELPLRRRQWLKLKERGGVPEHGGRADDHTVRPLGSQGQEDGRGDGISPLPSGFANRA